MPYLVLVVLVILSLSACDRSSFDASVDDHEVATAHSTITVPGDGFADGFSPVDVQLNLKNWQGEPLEGLVMEIEVSGTGNTMVPCTRSNATGWSRCRFYSTTAERKSVRMKGSATLEGWTVLHIPAGASSAFAVVSSSGDNTIGANGPRLVSSSGIVETNVKKEDSSGIVRIFSSILGSILND